MNLQSHPKLNASAYDRAGCRIGIVHLGYGAFHRAHQAVYVDQYMDQTGDLNWGIAAVNLRAADSSDFARHAARENGYLLKTTSPEAQVNYKLVRPHIAFADWSQDATAAEQLVDCDTVHILSMTVTESGYFLDNDGSLNTQDPVLSAELAGGPPASVYGYLANALAHRMGGVNQPITILCCDNIRSNGRVLERNFMTYLEARELFELAKWVGVNVTFPCSMVDRITPRASKELEAETSLAFPGLDLSPIHGESFLQWVLEDRFAADMPNLSVAGVQIVADVDPFEEAKIRILNGGHTGLCYLGALAGYDTFDQAMHDPELGVHFDLFETQNVLPGLSIDLPFDGHEYLEQITARFKNRAIADSLERICMDGWSKMQIFLRPTLEGCLAQGIAPAYTYECAASWYVYARRIAAGTMKIPYHEPYWDSLAPLLAAGQENAFATCSALWVDLPERYTDFVPDLVTAIRKMEEKWPA